MVHRQNKHRGIALILVTSSSTPASGLEALAGWMHLLWVKGEGLTAAGEHRGVLRVASPPPALCPAAPHLAQTHLMLTPGDWQCSCGSQPFTHGQPWPQWSVLLFAVMFWRSQTGIVYKEPAESCKDSAVRCDGVVDCSQRSDELGCGEAPRAGMGE